MTRQVRSAALALALALSCLGFVTSDDELVPTGVKSALIRWAPQHSRR
eukprot:COSAG01_NODE_35806_length_526_cov_1.088993_1_plen_47_part_10